jgi:carboxypeptidase C (cathepsin A)
LNILTQCSFVAVDVSRNRQVSVIAVLRLFSVAMVLMAAHAGSLQAQNQNPIVDRRAFSQSYTTHHELALPDRKIGFTATAENLVFTEPRGFPRAEMAYVAYTKDGADPATRPVAFVMNGGPGASSAYLNLLAIGPWRTPLGGARHSASLSTLQPNAETWLDFTDLVFIDPPGTGYSRVTGGERMREYFHSVHGDIDGLASFIQRWLRDKERLRSPVYFVGASYGGFRGPLLARKLQADNLKSFDGMVLISPVLDFELAPFGHALKSPWLSAAILPSLAAIWAERNSTLTPELLQEAEAYASGEYIADLLRGVDDSQAIERIADRVEKLTGIKPSVTKGLKGRVDEQAFVWDLKRQPAPNLGLYNVYEDKRTVEYSEDQDLNDVTRILAGEMDGYFRNTLGFQTSEKYKVFNLELVKTWRWNSGRTGVESASKLQQALDFDKGMRVLIAHGASDLTTPYYATKMLCTQIDAGQPRRLGFKLYGGNHLFYSREASRKALRADAQVFFESAQKVQTPVR